VTDTVETTDSIVTRVEDGVGWLILSNPTRANAISRRMALDLSGCWRRLDEDPDVAVIAVTGAGDRHFCAGADLRALETPGGVVEANETPGLTSRANSVEKPVIAVVNGAALGLGLSFIADADIVIASENAMLSDPHTAIGRIVSYAGLSLSTRLPAVEATALALGVAKMSAERAYHLGLVHALLPTPEDARAHVATIAEPLRTASPTAVIESVKLLRSMTRQPEDEVLLARAREVIDEFRDHPDGIEGPKARREGRQPVWQAR